MASQFGGIAVNQPTSQFGGVPVEQDLPSSYGIFSRIADDEAQNGQNFANLGNTDLSGAERALQGVGDYANIVGIPIKEGVSSLARGARDMITDPSALVGFPTQQGQQMGNNIQNAVTSAIGDTINSAPGTGFDPGTIGLQGISVLNQALKDNPRIASDINAGANILGAVPVVKGISGALSEVPAQTASDLVDQAGHNAIMDINKNYAAQKNVLNVSENAVRNTPIAVNSPDLLGYLNSAIKDSEKVATTTKEKSAVSQLESIRDKIVSNTSPGTSTILDSSGNPIITPPISPLDTNDLLDINSAIRSGLPSVNKAANAGTAIKLGLKSHVDDLLDNISQANPDFGAKYSDYRTNAQNFASTFNNDNLKPFFQPEDHVSYQAFQNGNAPTPYNTDTLNRANNFTKNLNTNNVGNNIAVANAMSPQGFKDVLAAAVDRARDLNPSALSTVISAAKKIYNPAEAAKELVGGFAKEAKPTPVIDFAKAYKGNPNAINMRTISPSDLKNLSPQEGLALLQQLLSPEDMQGVLKVYNGQ